MCITNVTCFHISPPPPSPHDLKVFIFSRSEVAPGVYECWGTFAESWGLKAYVTWMTLAVFIIPVLIITVCQVQVDRAHLNRCETLLWSGHHRTPGVSSSGLHLLGNLSQPVPEIRAPPVPRPPPLNETRKPGRRRKRRWRGGHCPCLSLPLHIPQPWESGQPGCWFNPPEPASESTQAHRGHHTAWTSHLQHRWVWPHDPEPRGETKGWSTMCHP